MLPDSVRRSGSSRRPVDSGPQGSEERTRKLAADLAALADKARDEKVPVDVRAALETIKGWR